MKKVMTLFVLVLFSGILTANTEQKPSQIIKDISAVEAAALLKDSKVVILDIRTKDEFDSGHIKGALNIDFYQPDFISNISKLDKSKRYFIYCRSGRRSGIAMENFRNLGFLEVYNLEKGILQWSAEKYKLVK